MNSRSVKLNDSERPEYHVAAVRKALELFCQFSSGVPHLSVSELSRRLELPKSTTHNLLRTHTERQAVRVERGRSPGGWPESERRAGRPAMDQWINRAAFTLNTGAYRPRRWSSITGRLREPPVHNFDLGLMKNFRITERVTFQFINNWVNAFNTPQWYGSVGNPRQIQLAGRLSS